MHYELLLKSSELKEIVLLQCLKTCRNPQTFDEITQQTGFGCSTIELSFKSLVQKIQNLDFHSYITLHKETGKRKLWLEATTPEMVEKFEKKLIETSAGFRLIHHLFLDSTQSIRKLAKRSNISQTSARTILNSFSDHLEEKGIVFTKRGKKAIASEEVKRELIIQFFTPFLINDFWPIPTFSPSCCEKIARNLLEITGISQEVTLEEFQKFVLRIGVFLHREFVQRKTLPADFLKDEDWMGDIISLEAIDTFVSSPLDKISLKYLVFQALHLSTHNDIFLKTAYYEQNKEVIQEFTDLFFNLLEERNEKKKQVIKIKSTKILFYLHHLGAITLTKENLLHNQKEFKNIFIKGLALYKQHLHSSKLRSSLVFNTFVENLKEVFSDKKKCNIAILCEEEKAKILKEKISSIFQGKFEITFESEKDSDLIIVTSLNESSPFTSKLPVLFVPGELQFSDYEKINNILSRKYPKNN